MKQTLLTIKYGLKLHKWMFVFFAFILLAVFGLWWNINLRIKMMLVEKVRVDIQKRLIESGVPVNLQIEHEKVHTDTMLLQFYLNRTFQPAWINNRGPLSICDSLVEAIRLAKHEGLNPDHYHIQTIESCLDSLRTIKKTNRTFEISRLRDFDLLMTDAYLLYGSHLLSGHIDPETVDPEWISDNQEEDIIRVLAVALKKRQVKKSLCDLLPAFPEYRRLRDELGRYRSIAWRGGWPVVPMGPPMKPDDTGFRVAALRARLMATGDYETDSFSEEAVYDSTMAAAVRRFQQIHDLDEDSAIGDQTRLALNEPALHYVRKLSANMERWRWLPKIPEDRYVFINIAAYTLKVFEKGKDVLSMRVVVGKDYRQTPVFTGSMTHLVLNPYWNVPPTIAKEDMLPQIKKDTSYLTSRNIEVFSGWNPETPINPDSIDWASVSPDSLFYHFRQPPGKDNALGKIKFIFPNKYDVYMHDTPYHSFFKKRERAYSSGCIRLEDPLALAEYLLKDQPEWNRESIQTVLDNNENLTIDLTEPIQIYIFYSTAWPVDEKTIHYYRDIYDRDALLENAMMQEAFLPI